MKALQTFLIVLIFASCSSSKDQTVAEDNLPVTYSNSIKKIVDKKCMFCHNSNKAAKGLDLSTYEKVKASAQNGVLLQRINDADKPMPKSGLMSSKYRDAFKKWKENGFAK